MKFYTDRKKRFHVRCRGAYATYPIFKNGVHVLNLECYSECVSGFLKKLNETGIVFRPFFEI